MVYRIRDSEAAGHTHTEEQRENEYMPAHTRVLLSNKALAPNPENGATHV